MKYKNTAQYTVDTGYYFLMFHNLSIYTAVNLKVGKYDDIALLGFPAAT
jgi:hypothetical protein